MLASVRSLANAIQHAGVADSGASAFVPLDRQRLPGFEGMPVGVSHHGHTVGNLHHVNHAWHGLGLAGVKAFHSAANDRALLQAGVHHPRQFDINAEFGGAVDLARGVQALGGFTDQTKVFRVFQHHFFGHRQLRCGFRKRAVGSFFPVGSSDYSPVGCERGGIHIPLCGGRGNQHGAHLCARCAQLFPAFANRR